MHPDINPDKKKASKSRLLLVVLHLVVLGQPLPVLPHDVLADEVLVAQRGGAAAGVAAAVVPRLRHHGRRVEGPVGAVQLVGDPEVPPGVGERSRGTGFVFSSCCGVQQSFNYYLRTSKLRNLLPHSSSGHRYWQRSPILSVRLASGTSTEERTLERTNEEKSCFLTFHGCFSDIIAHTVVTYNRTSTFS